MPEGNVLEENIRVDYDGFRTRVPDAHAALLDLGKAVDTRGLEKDLTELVKLRVSQINGCAFCLQLHLNIARKLGVEAAKLDLVGVWRDAPVFSDREAAALAWAETVTRLPGQGTGGTDWAALREHFTEEEALLLTVTVGTINAWNRITVALGFSPPIPA